MNSMNWIAWVVEGVMGTCAWFGARSMHSMSGLSLTWHWHVGWGHMH